MADQTQANTKETNKGMLEKNRNVEFFCKALGTIGLWAGCSFLGFFGLIILIGPIIALFIGVIGTIAIWCPQHLKDK